MPAVGWLLIIGGLILVAVGIAILILAAIQLWRQMFYPPSHGAGDRNLLPPGISVADLTKLIEAIIKIPQWLLAILAGNLEIYFGYWLATGTRLF